MDSKYKSYKDIVALEVICKGYEELFSTQCSKNNLLVTPKVQVVDKSGIPYIGYDTQIYSGYDITPDAGYSLCTPGSDYAKFTEYAMCAPEMGYIQSYNCTPLQPYAELSQFGNCDQNENIAEIKKYKHRTDFSKRQRRKYSEMERNYDCDYTGCCKSYESISHLNTHRYKKDHGAKMSIYDFAE